VHEAARKADEALALDVPAQSRLARAQHDEIDGQFEIENVDDAQITLTYAQNIASGEGFVFSRGGERVEGSTSLLWTLICTAAVLTPLPERTLTIVSLVLAAGAAVKPVRWGQLLLFGPVLAAFSALLFVKALVALIEERPAQILPFSALRLLIMTGARLTEILDAQWPSIDLEKGVLSLTRHL
jgi:hypothetical protein